MTIDPSLLDGLPNIPRRSSSGPAIRKWRVCSWCLAAGGGNSQNGVGGEKLPIRLDCGKT